MYAKPGNANLRLIGLIVFAGLFLVSLRQMTDTLEINQEAEPPVKQLTSSQTDENVKKQPVSVVADLVSVPAESKPDVVVTGRTLYSHPPTLNTERSLESRTSESKLLVDKSESKPGNGTQAVSTSTVNARKYIKLGPKGEKLANSAELWACVEDTKTGLVWEVKSAISGLHHSENLYSWYLPDGEVKFRGAKDAGQCEGSSDCDTRAYVRAVNEESYCGFSDWRVPTREEMLSIVKLDGKEFGVTIDTDYFPQTLSSWYWTATDNEAYPEYAWYLLFRNGVTLSGRKDRPRHLRLVRSVNPAAK